MEAPPLASSLKDCWCLNIDAAMVAAMWISFAVFYCILGAVSGGLIMGYLQEFEFAWICPEDLVFNASTPFDMIESDHPEVDRDDWRNVVSWIHHNDWSIMVHSPNRASFAAKVTFPYKERPYDFRVHPTKCFGVDCGNDQCTTVVHMNANNFNDLSMDPLDLRFVRQALVGAAGMSILVCLFCVVSKRNLR